MLFSPVFRLHEYRSHKFAYKNVLKSENVGHLDLGLHFRRSARYSRVWAGCSKWQPVFAILDVHLQRLRFRTGCFQQAILNFPTAQF